MKSAETPPALQGPLSLAACEELTSTCYDFATPLFFNHKRQGLNDDEADEIKIFVDLLPKGKRKVLDAGCGTARFAPYFQTYGIEYVGIDISKESLKLARKHTKDTTLLHMSICNMTFPPETFDGFWSVMSLHNTPKREISKALLPLHRVIKPQGIGYILIPRGNEDRIETFEEFPKATAHSASYSAVEFAVKLRDSGFKILHHAEDFFQVSFPLLSHRFIVAK